MEKTKKLKFDIMVGDRYDRYYKTLVYEHCPLFALDLDKVEEFIFKECPSLRHRKYRIEFYEDN